MSGDQRKVSRRAVLAAAGGLASVGSVAAQIEGGTVALNEAYNAAGDLWIGPDTAKDTVDPETGRVYMATDTQVEYYADGDGWTKMGVGSSSEPVPEVTSNSLSTEHAYSGGQTIYVRSDGDDSQDGLSAENAKATVQAAADDGPLHLDGGEPLIIDVGSGTFGAVNLKHVAASRSVNIVGATDGSGNPDTTLDGGGIDSTLVADNCRVTAENLILQNGAYANGYATKCGALDLQNCELRGGTNTPLNAAADGSSNMKIRYGSEMNTDAGSATGFSHATSVGSEMTVRDVAFSGTGVDQGVVGAKQASFVHVDGCSINADGAGRCIRVVDGSDLKLGPSAITFENAEAAVYTARNSDVTDKADPGVHTYNNIDNEWKIEDGSYAESADGDKVFSPPAFSRTNVSNTFPGDAFIGTYFGRDTESDHFVAHEPGAQAWQLASLQKVASGQVSLSAGGEQDIDIPESDVNGALLVAHFPATTDAGNVEYIIRHTGGSNTASVRFKEVGGTNPATHDYAIYSVPLL